MTTANRLWHISKSAAEITLTLTAFALWLPVFAILVFLYEMITLI